MRAALEQKQDIPRVARHNSGLAEASFELWALASHCVSPARAIAAKIIDRGGNGGDRCRRHACSDGEAVEMAVDARALRIEHRNSREESFEINHSERLVHARQQQRGVFWQLVENLGMRPQAAESDAAAAACRRDE
jgi:hypothetical protein